MGSFFGVTSRCTRSSYYLQSYMHTSNPRDPQSYILTQLLRLWALGKKRNPLKLTSKSQDPSRMLTMTGIIFEYLCPSLGCLFLFVMVMGACVVMRQGTNAGGNTKPAATRPAAKVQFAADLEALRTQTQATKQDQRAPIKMVSRRAWSPGIYLDLSLLWKMLDVAWERAFICSLTFN